MCPHTPIYVSCRGQELSAPYRICFEASYAYMCPHTPIYMLIHAYKCVLVHLYMCRAGGKSGRHLTAFASRLPTATALSVW